MIPRYRTHINGRHILFKKYRVTNIITSTKPQRGKTNQHTQIAASVWEIENIHKESERNISRCRTRERDI